jgi:hypothetical protein
MREGHEDRATKISTIVVVALFLGTLLWWVVLVVIDLLGPMPMPELKPAIYHGPTSCMEAFDVLLSRHGWRDS